MSLYFNSMAQDKDEMPKTFIQRNNNIVLKTQMKYKKYLNV